MAIVESYTNTIGVNVSWLPISKTVSFRFSLEQPQCPCHCNISVKFCWILWRESMRPELFSSSRTFLETAVYERKDETGKCKWASHQLSQSFQHLVDNWKISSSIYSPLIKLFWFSGNQFVLFIHSPGFVTLADGLVTVSKIFVFSTEFTKPIAIVPQHRGSDVQELQLKYIQCMWKLFATSRKAGGSLR